MTQKKAMRAAWAAWVGALFGVIGGCASNGIASSASDAHSGPHVFFAAFTSYPGDGGTNAMHFLDSKAAVEVLSRKMIDPKLLPEDATYADAIEKTSGKRLLVLLPGLTQAEIEGLWTHRPYREMSDLFEKKESADALSVGLFLDCMLNPSVVNIDRDAGERAGYDTFCMVMDESTIYILPFRKPGSSLDRLMQNKAVAGEADTASAP